MCARNQLLAVEKNTDNNKKKWEFTKSSLLANFNYVSEQQPHRDYPNDNELNKKQKNMLQNSINIRNDTPSKFNGKL